MFKVFSEAKGRKDALGQEGDIRKKNSAGGLVKNEAEPRKLNKIRLTQVKLNGPGDGHLTQRCVQERGASGALPKGEQMWTEAPVERRDRLGRDSAQGTMAEKLPERLKGRRQMGNAEL